MSRSPPTCRLCFGAARGRPQRLLPPRPRCRCLQKESETSAGGATHPSEVPRGVRGQGHTLEDQASQLCQHPIEHPFAFFVLLRPEGGGEGFGYLWPNIVPFRSRAQRQPEVRRIKASPHVVEGARGTPSRYSFLSTPLDTRFPSEFCRGLIRSSARASAPAMPKLSDKDGDSGQLSKSICRLWKQRNGFHSFVGGLAALTAA